MAVQFLVTGVDDGSDQFFAVIQQGDAVVVAVERMLLGDFADAGEDQDLALLVRDAEGEGTVVVGDHADGRSLDHDGDAERRLTVFFEDSTGDGLHRLGGHDAAPEEEKDSQQGLYGTESFADWHVGLIFRIG